MDLMSESAWTAAITTQLHAASSTETTRETEGIWEGMVVC
jgi:hypothetical protein